jgi:Flp pilus assembly protein TadD/cell division protein FtsN
MLASDEQQLNAKKFAMTRSTRLATLRVAALSLTLASVATGASAAGLLDFLRGSNEATQTTDVPESVARANYNPTPGGKSDNAPLDLNTALMKAQLSRKMGDFAEATKILSQLVLFAPDDSRVMGEYGKTLAAQGKSDDALAFLDRAIQIRPDDWTFYSAAGVAYDQKGQYRQAQENYSRALLLKPGEPSVLNNAALSYMQVGDIDMAEQMIRQAAATSTDKSRIEYTIALVERAKASRPQKSAPIPAPVASAPEPAPQAPAIVASVAPAPEPPQTTYTPEPPQATYTPEPPPAEPIPSYDEPAIESSALPPLEEPVEDWVDVTPEVAAPEIEIPSTSLASLQSNPTVVMQAVPKDDLAGPVQQRAEPKPLAAPAAPKPAAQTPPARRQLSVSANPPLTTTPQVAQAAPAPKADVVHTYYVQAGAFATEERADKLAQSLDMMGARVSPTTVGGKSLYRVRIGPFKDAQQASDALDVAKSLGHTDVKVVTE